MRVRCYAAASILLCHLILPSGFANPPVDEPSVSRRILVCDLWQWIGGSATTWGCLRAPREAHVAGGEATDQVIAALEKKIDDLEARVRKLEGP